MKSFKHLGKTVDFWKMTGTVLASSKQSHTHVSSSGGGGYLYQGTGYVNAPKIHSHTVTSQEFWLKTPTGDEVPVKLTNTDIPLREGQEISMISAGQKGRGYYTTLVNHSANRHWGINGGASLNRLFRLDTFKGASILILAAVYGLSMIPIFLDNSTLQKIPFAALTALPYLVNATVLMLILRHFWKRFRIKRMIASLDHHIEGIAQQVYRRDG